MKNEEWIENIIAFLKSNDIKLGISDSVLLRVPYIFRKNPEVPEFILTSKESLEKPNYHSQYVKFEGCFETTKSTEEDRKVPQILATERYKFSEVTLLKK